MQLLHPTLVACRYSTVTCGHCMLSFPALQVSKVVCQASCLIVAPDVQPSSTAAINPVRALQVRRRRRSAQVARSTCMEQPRVNVQQQHPTEWKLCASA